MCEIDLSCGPGIGIRQENMGSSINLTAIYVTDIVGIVLLFLILVTKGWILPARRRESRILCILIIISIINCAFDAYLSYCDGKPGTFYYFISMVGNTYMYMYYLMVGIGIIMLTVMHIDKNVPRFQSIFFGLIAVIEVGLLIANFFTPLVFSVDANNVYHREAYYMAFVMGGMFLMVYGFAFYFISKIQTPTLRYLPVWQFLVPVALGVIIQYYAYGISLQPISFSIAFTGLVICLQNECIYIDKLTGVYNRYELDKVIKAISVKHNEQIAALMLDMNDFKSINDTYSHEEGDEALVAFADILMQIVKSEGSVIRFAGDEFIIVIRKFKGDDIESYRTRIMNAVREYNERSGKPYKLSAAVGGCVFNCNDKTGFDLVTMIDELMYKDKQKFYKISGKVR